MKEIVHYESDEAAKKITTEVWVSRHDRMFMHEHTARWDGCTHTKCHSCGVDCDKRYVNCQECREKSHSDFYYKMPFIEWDEQTPLCLHDSDEFFWCKEDVIEFCYGGDLNPEELKLVVCDPQYAHEINFYEIYDELLPEDISFEYVAPELAQAFKELNEKIKNYKKPLSWTAGQYRTTISVKKA